MKAYYIFKKEKFQENTCKIPFNLKCRFMSEQESDIDLNKEKALPFKAEPLYKFDKFQFI